jgi:hypothetical protein
MIKFVSDLQQVGGFLWVPRFPPPIKLTDTIKLKYCRNRKQCIVLHVNRTGFGEFKLNYLTQFEIFSFEVVLMNDTSMLISVDFIA